ncbi:proline--tRNA ligase [Patescibacteria group bacterium]
MRQSTLFPRTQRLAKRDMKFASHKLLYRGGFVRELSSGRYEFLPLGMRVWKKVVDLIDKEMESMGSQRFSIPILQPIDIWKKSNRDKAWGNLLMKIEDRNNAEFALSATGEGVVTDMIVESQPTYKDLPIILHQFIIKFRDEMRPRGGLLRVREFVMKDAYSYHVSEKDFMKTYNNFYKSYSAICEKLGLEYYPVIADSGALGGDFCHEFQIPCEAGEDTIAKCDKCDYAANVEMAKFVRKQVNKSEKLKKQKIIKQKWTEARTIKEMTKFFGRPEDNMIKSVMYKSGRKLVIGIVTGDLEVNPVKLAKAVGVDELDKATKKDLVSIGATSGALHAWGYDEHKNRITFVADKSIAKAKNLYGGYKTKTTDPMYSNYGRDFESDIVADIAEPHDDAKCKSCKNGKLKLIRTVEFGHIFKYDHFYTQHHDGFFTDKNGKKKLMYMGAYGIGIGRAIAVVVEKHNDERGIIWPKEIAPFDVHLIGLKNGDAEKVYDKLTEAGIEVLWDDRDIGAGAKFADADLIGIPIRLVVSEKTGDKVEWKGRSSEKVALLNLKEAITKLVE